MVLELPAPLTHLTSTEQFCFSLFCEADIFNNVATDLSTSAR